LRSWCSSLSLLLPLGLSGCASTWVPGIIVDTSPTITAWFRDADADGWGTTDGVMATQDDAAAQGFTAQNDRDCDDDDADVTGHVAPLCPDQIGSDFVPVVYGTTEFLVVTASSPMMSAAGAQDECGKYGWGGALAAFEANDDLDAVEATLATVSPWAGWIGVVPNGGDWTWDPEQASVVGGALNLQSFAACDPAPHITGDPARDHLALVKGSSGTLCLGYPPSAGGDYALADNAGLAHFVCERPAPDPAAFILFHTDDAPSP
jgi:hypothetical protein